MCASETTFIKHLIYITSEDHRSSNSIHNNKKFEMTSFDLVYSFKT